jgi:4-hydroxybenzoate polyprenyltransferase
MKENPLTLLFAVMWLLRGGPALVKLRLSDGFDAGAAHLPYDREVVTYLEAERAAGRRIYLATAAARPLAAQIAAHLGLFDGIIATDAGANRKGTKKLEAIQAQTGGAPFEYLGDSSADLPIWSAAGVAGIVNATDSVAARAERVAPVSFRLGARRASPRAMLRAIRPHQWAKNVLIFVPLLSSHRVTDLAAILIDALVFVAFCLCASAVYLINDLLDLPSDRLHAHKRLRPLAAGELSIRSALLASAGFFILAFALAFAVSLPVVAVLAVYFALTLAYSLSLKQIAMLDVIVLAGLYTLRIIAGFVAVAVPLSFWLLAFSLFIFVSLALMKRCSELHNLRKAALEKVHGRGYVAADYEQLASLGSASGYISILILALYMNSAEVVKLYARPEILWGVCPIVLYWVSRAWLLAHRGQMNEDPIVFALRDRVSYACAALCAACAVAATLL